MRHTTTLICMLLLTCTMVFRCSNTNLSGATDMPNEIAVVTGTILTPGGQYASNTRVLLLSHDHNPVIDGPVPDSLIDTTNELGSYSISLSDTGTFNIEAWHLTQQTCLLVTGIVLRNDTTIVPLASIKEPGVVQLIMPDTIDTINSYVYFEGTTMYRSLAEVIAPQLGKYELTLDSVPEAIFSTIHYYKLNDILARLTDTVPVASKDTTVIDISAPYINFTKNDLTLPENNIHDIYFNSMNGDTWFSTWGGGIALLTSSTPPYGWIRYNTGNSLLPSDEIYRTSQDSSGTIWVATSGGAASYNGVQWTSYTTGNSDLPSNLVTGVHTDPHGKKWFCTLGGGLAMFNNSAWTIYSTADSNWLSDDIFDVSFGDDDTVWCATAEGVIKFKDQAMYSYTSFDTLGLQSDEIFRLLITKNGEKWFGGNGGVVCLNGITMIGYTTGDSPILRDSVHAIIEDYKGNIWIGTSHGLTMFDGTHWNDYTSPKYHFLDNKTIYTIAPYGASEMKWVGTAKNGVFLF